jgi:integrase/recombinase XerD
MLSGFGESMDKLFEQFLREKTYLVNLQPRTLDIYQQTFDRYFKSMGKSKSSVQECVIQMKERGLADTTINIAIRNINSFLTWLYENEHTTEHLKLKQLRQEKKTIQGYSDSDIKKLVSYRPTSFSQHRIHTLVCLLAETGIRVEEALPLLVANIDFDNFLLVVKGKGNKQRIVPFGVELRRVLFRLTKKHNQPYLFGTRTGTRLSYHNAMKGLLAVLKAVGVENRGFHGFRRFYAKNFVQHGGDVFTLQRLMGHADLKTTQVYVDVRTEDLKLAHKQTSILGRLHS